MPSLPQLPTLPLKVLAIALAFLAAFLLTRTLAEQLTRWWNTRIQGYAAWMTIEFESMFAEMTIDQAKKYISAMVFTPALFGLLFGSGFAGRVLAMAVFGLAGYFLPWGFVVYRRKRRLGAIDDQLIDTLQMMANALKAGLSLQQALELVVHEMKPPISDEFGRLVKEIHLGRLTDDALRHFAERVPLEDVQLSVDSILTLRETGANLSETFGTIAKTIIERKKVEGKIKAMTAQGMAQGVLICMFPPGMLLLFSMIDANFVRPFFSTPIGIMLLVLVFLLDGMGLWMMFKLVKVDV
jgi:tight adherence protein B